MSRGPATAVAFQGEAGAYGEEAASYLVPGLRAVGLGSFDAVFDAVRSGDMRYGVVPVENIYAGPVSGIADSWQRTGTVIAADLWLPVRHVLAGLPGSRREDITLVSSHPQALAQCAPYLHAHGITARASTNTATAARELRQDGRLSEAVIASPTAARRFGLQVLDDNVSAVPANRTRFWLLSRDPRPPDGEGRLRFTAVAAVPNPGETASALAWLRLRGGSTERVIPLSGAHVLLDGAAPTDPGAGADRFSLWSVYPRRTPPP
ncbi:MAG: prephenate dehydratase [Clostridia bacterium]